MSAAAWGAMVCQVVSGAFSFGGYDVFDTTPRDSAAHIVVSCTRVGGAASTTVTVGLGPSANSGVTNARRLRRSGGAETLDYNFFRDPAMVSVWGQTVGVDTVTRVITLPNNASGQLVFTVYGRIPASQNARVGDYSDQILVIVSF